MYAANMTNGLAQTVRPSCPLIPSCACAITRAAAAHEHAVYSLLNLIQTVTV